MQNQETNPQDNTGSEMGLLGEYLKQKRLDRNYSLEKLSQKTKISINILKSLEANDYDHLPSAAYIKGFVTSYVKVLGLPLDEAITKMEYTYLNVLGKPFPALNHTKNFIPTSVVKPSPQSHAGVASPAAEAPVEASPHEIIESSDSIMENTKSILPIVIFGVVILVFIGGYKLISSVVEGEVNSQKTKDLGPKIESSSALVNQEPKKVEPPKTETTAPVAATAETKTEAPVTPAPEVKPEPEKPLPDFPRNFPTIDFKKIKGSLFTVRTDAPENSDENFISDKVKSSMNSELQNVYIKAVNGNTWLSYKIDNNPIESVILSKDNDLFLQGSEIRVFLGNVNVTKIFYNNHIIDAPTKSGVKSLIFPEENASKYQLPLFPKAKDDILYTSEDYIKRMKLEEEELEKRKATH